MKQFKHYVYCLIFSLSNTYVLVQTNGTTDIIFKLNGDELKGEVRKAFWHTIDAYKATLEYLIKRSPVYKK